MYSPLHSHLNIAIQLIYSQPTEAGFPAKVTQPQCNPGILLLLRCWTHGHSKKTTATFHLETQRIPRHRTSFSQFGAAQPQCQNPSCRAAGRNAWVNQPQTSRVQDTFPTEALKPMSFNIRKWSSVEVFPLVSPCEAFSQVPGHFLQGEQLGIAKTTEKTQQKLLGLQLSDV